ncbi:MAG: CHRD domain-containing protein [Gemmatimonas sp.]|nr:CHRD domain-containing protein [Gemmatimonas sp.]
MFYARRFVTFVLFSTVAGCSSESPTDLVDSGPQLVKIPGAATGGLPLTTMLSGDAEVPPADPDGTGSALVTLNQGQDTVCFQLEWSDIAAPTRAHIHRGVAGVNGGIVVAFFDFVDPAPETGCVAADAELVKEIRQNPADFYVNIHNDDFPGGAVRGQL